VRYLAMWWPALSLLGWLTWPLIASVFRQLPSRGYGYARTFGLLLLCYAHWLLCTAGILPNDARSVGALGALLAAIGCVVWVRKRVDLVDHLRREWRQVLTVEALFAAVLLVYALHRSYDAAIAHTEMPMDFAFLNGILRSPYMPPHDPWLSGLPISYYYFGHLTVSVLVRLTGLPAGVGYNLGLAHTLALTVVGGYTLIYDLVRSHGGRQGSCPSKGDENGGVMSRRACAAISGRSQGSSLHLASRRHEATDALRGRRGESCIRPVARFVIPSNSMAVNAPFMGSRNLSKFLGSPEGPPVLPAPGAQAQVSEAEGRNLSCRVQDEIPRLRCAPARNDREGSAAASDFQGSYPCRRAAPQEGENGGAAPCAASPHHTPSPFTGRGPGGGVAGLSDERDFQGRGSQAQLAHLFGLLGGIALAVAGNLEGVVELSRARGLGSEAFYRWLDVPGLAEAWHRPSWLPGGGWWWWRASRIILDRNILGRTPTVITEFPAFSFILGDLHAHLMSLPYVLMALALACELYLVGRSGPTRARLRQPRFWAIPLVFGVLGFVNTLDLPTFAAIGALAAFAGRWRDRNDWRPWLRECLLLGLWITLGSVALFLPFYLGLSSQVQGIGLVYYAKTPLKHYLLCFGPWLLPILADAVADLTRRRSETPAPEVSSETPADTSGERLTSVPRWRTFLGIWILILLLPWLGTGAIGGWGRVLLGVISVVSTGPWLLLLQSGLMATLLLRIREQLRRASASRDGGQLLSDGLVLTGIGLTYATEFFYLRDAFDTRMNTVFKLYYQAWVLLGIGATLAAFRLWRSGGSATQRRWWRTAVVLSGLVLCACMCYPVAAAYSKAGGYRGQPALDGTAFLRAESPAEYGAFIWLKSHAQPGDVLVEAVGQDFVPSHNRLSAWTGVPTILGWPGHEAQWRGDDGEVLRRLRDVERIYSSANREEIVTTLREYDATYLYVGPHEREKHAIDARRLAWYASFLETAYSQGGVTMFRVPGS